jgi:hypothetical protein
MLLSERFYLYYTLYFTPKRTNFRRIHTFDDVTQTCKVVLLHPNELPPMVFDNRLALIIRRGRGRGHRNCRA